MQHTVDSIISVSYGKPQIRPFLCPKAFYWLKKIQHWLRRRELWLCNKIFDRKRCTRHISNVFVKRLLISLVYYSRTQGKRRIAQSSMTAKETCFRATESVFSDPLIPLIWQCQKPQNAKIWPLRGISSLTKNVNNSRYVLGTQTITIGH